MKNTVSSAIASLFLSIGVAQANTPLNLEQILCRGDAIVTGTVVDAESRDCRLTGPNTCPYQHVWVEIRIDSVLLNGDDLRQDQHFKGIANFLNGRPMMIGDKAFPMNDPEVLSFFSFPPTGKAVGTALARGVLLGKQFIFTVGHQTQNPDFYLAPFDMKHMPWVSSVVTDPGCAKHNPVWHAYSGPG